MGSGGTCEPFKSHTPEFLISGATVYSSIITTRTFERVRVWVWTEHCSRSISPSVKWPSISTSPKYGSEHPYCRCRYSWSWRDPTRSVELQYRTQHWRYI